MPYDPRSSLMAREDTDLELKAIFLLGDLSAVRTGSNKLLHLLNWPWRLFRVKQGVI